jgi:probable addiction module antidote protein
MTEKIIPFDIAEHLKTDEDIRAFLQESAANATATEFIHALNTAARAKGMTEVATLAGVSRTSLYKSLSGQGKPEFATIAKVVEALGCKLVIS